MAHSQQKTKKHKKIEEIFQEINREHVRIKRKERKDNNCILYSVLEKLLDIMRKCDNLFASMRPRLEYLGSYYDGLRVGQPTEYDINVILTIHINYDKIKLNAEKAQNGYTYILMREEFRRLSKTPSTAAKGFKKTEFWCDNLFRLSVTNFRSWMQGVLDAALGKLPLENDKYILNVNEKLYKINFKTAGPANNVTIYIKDDYVIDVDLVPTLAFELPKKPEHSKIDFNKVKGTGVSFYFAVPKPSDNEYSWRLAFPYQERFFTNNKNNLKSTLKLLKLFRDIQGFDKLASYFIKTLFLWEVLENHKKERFWVENSLSTLVVYMLKKLRDCLLEGRIRNFWCAEHNLLEKIKLGTCRNWSNRINNVINSIEHNKLSNPKVVYKFFTEPTKKTNETDYKQIIGQ